MKRIGVKKSKEGNETAAASPTKQDSAAGGGNNGMYTSISLAV